MSTSNVTVVLYADGVDTGKSVVLCADNSWKGVFDGLDKYTEGRLVVYSVGELNVPEGYTVSIENNTNTFTVTNTHVPEKKQKLLSLHGWYLVGVMDHTSITSPKTIPISSK